MEGSKFWRLAGTMDRKSAEELIDYVDGLDVILGRSDLCGGEAQIQ